MWLHKWQLLELLEIFTGFFAAYVQKLLLVLPLFGAGFRSKTIIIIVILIVKPWTSKYPLGQQGPPKCPHKDKVSKQWTCTVRTAGTCTQSTCTQSTHSSLFLWSGVEDLSRNQGHEGWWPSTATQCCHTLCTGNSSLSAEHTHTHTQLKDQ